MPNIHLALMHYPVLGKRGEEIAAAVTNLDVHDIARTARTYAVKAVYIVTPLTDQLEMVDKIRRYWISGAGSVHNPKRKEAFSILHLRDSLDAVTADMERDGRGAPALVATSARERDGVLPFERFKSMLADGRPYLLLFGTAWGLSETVFQRADYTLAPVAGPGAYNHLPVRAAVAVVLDRLQGR